MAIYFDTILYGRNEKYALNHIDGEGVLYTIGASGSAGADLIEKEQNLNGPHGTWIPGYGDFYYDIGWAIDGGYGNDTISGNDEPDWLYGNEGDDVLKGLEERDLLEGGAGNDKLYGGDDDDLLDGGEGNDYLDGGAGKDEMHGGYGNDSYRIREGDADTVVEGVDGGIDTVYLAGNSHTLATNVERLVLDAGWSQAARLTGNASDNEILGADGADSLHGEAGSDLLRGGAGHDWLYGGADADTLFGGTGADVLFGDAGEDYLDGEAGADTMKGGAGNDTYVVSDTSDVVIEFANHGIDTVQSLLQSTTLSANVENLWIIGTGTSEGFGNALDNGMTGNAWNNYLDGGAGNDVISGEFGNDTLNGGEGNDELSGGYNNDVLHGDAGNDLVDGGEGTDFVHGDAGNDTVLGGGGNDFLYGGDGNDVLRGGDGNDLIRGQAGADRLHGDAGADRFIFSSTQETAVGSFDRIMDFVRGQDKIDLSGIDAEMGAAGNQAFHFTGSQPFFGSEGDLWTRATLIGSMVEGDVNGDGAADFAILVTGVWDLAASDFVL